MRFMFMVLVVVYAWLIPVQGFRALLGEASPHLLKPVGNAGEHAMQHILLALTLTDPFDLPLILHHYNRLVVG